MPRKHKWQAERERKIKERVRLVKKTLHVGQALYLAGFDTPHCACEDIVLETARIVEIPRRGKTVNIEMPDGSIREMDVYKEHMDNFYLSMLEDGPEIDYIVFTSEENFWDWRDWEINVVRLNSYGYVICGYEEFPTSANLAVLRILSDILINENEQYQNLSCEGCPNKSQSVGESCAGCVRNKTLKDLWAGKSDREPALNGR